jgi:hypothetical protein
MMRVFAALVAVGTATAQIPAPTSPQAVDCYADMGKDGAMCDDHSSGTKKDECYQGACGTWINVPTVVGSEAERLAWATHEKKVSGKYLKQCGECTDRKTNINQWPKYLALSPKADHGHGMAATNAAVHSYLDWKGKGKVHWTAWRAPDAAKMGDMRSRALFMSAGGSSCVVQGEQYQADCRSLMIRSENQVAVEGYKYIEVFVPVDPVKISNIKTHSKLSYVAEPIAVGQPYYTDRGYVINDLPRHLQVRYAPHSTH